MDDAQKRDVTWPAHTARKGARQTATLVAFWRYEGTHPDGHDHACHGDLDLARYAFSYWTARGQDDDLVQRIPPSQARVKAEVSDFGRVYAFRATDPDRLRTWGRGAVCLS